MKYLFSLLLVGMFSLGFAQSEVSRSLETVASEWGEEVTCDVSVYNEEIFKPYADSLLEVPFDVSCYLMYIPVVDYQPYINQTLYRDLNWNLIQIFTWGKHVGGSYAITYNDGIVDNAVVMLPTADEVVSYLAIYNWENNLETGGNTNEN